MCNQLLNKTNKYYYEVKDATHNITRKKIL